MIFEVIYETNQSVHIHAENLHHAILKAKRLGRSVFFTVRCKVSKCINPSAAQVLIADQCQALLGEPVPVKSQPSTKVEMSNLWLNFQQQLEEAGL